MLPSRAGLDQPQRLERGNVDTGYCAIAASHDFGSDFALARAQLALFLSLGARLGLSQTALRP